MVKLSNGAFIVLFINSMSIGFMMTVMISSGFNWWFVGAAALHSWVIYDVVQREMKNKGD